MSRKYMITGGASSGKSEWAAAFFGDDPKCKNLTYISTSDEVSPVISKLMKNMMIMGRKQELFSKKESRLLKLIRPAKALSIFSIIFRRWLPIFYFPVK